jgi:hypothetical protein
MAGVARDHQSSRKARATNRVQAGHVLPFRLRLTD